MMNANNHNMQALELERQAELAIKDRLVGCESRWGEIAAALEREPAVIDNETTAESITTIVAQLQALRERIELNRRDVKEPYYGAAGRVDSIAGVVRDKVQDAMDRLLAKLNSYQNAKQKRIDEERAAIAAREAADPEPSWTPPAGPAVRRTRVRSVEGASAHLTTEIRIEIEDFRQIPLRYLKRPKVVQALISEMRSDAQKGDEIEGVTIHRDTKTRVKR